MAAEIGEEVGVERNRLGRQHRPRGSEQGGLGRRARLLLCLGGLHAELEPLQAIAVDLAGGQPRQRLDRLEAGGHHIGGQQLAQLRPEAHHIECLVAPHRDHEGDELVETVVGPQHHGRLADAVALSKRRLDLAELDPEAADLHLVVDAAAEMDAPVLIHHHRVAGAVEDRIRAVAAEGIGDELFPRQRIAVEIAARHAGAADQQLALDASVEQPK